MEHKIVLEGNTQPSRQFFIHNSSNVIELFKSINVIILMSWVKERNFFIFMKAPKRKYERNIP